MPDELHSLTTGQLNANSIYRPSDVGQPIELARQPPTRHAIVELLQKGIKPSLETLQPAAPTGRFRFLDLPPDIRNRIYTLLLATSTHVLILAEASTPAARATHCAGKEWYSVGDGEHIMASPIRAIKPSSILFANQQIRNEIAPMLYGQIKFKFSAIGCRSITFPDFARSINDMLRLLRDVTLCGFSKDKFKEAFKALQGADKLILLTILLSSGNWFDASPSFFAVGPRRFHELKDCSDLFPTLRTLVRTHQGKRKSSNQDDALIVRFRKPRGEPCIRWRTHRCSQSCVKGLKDTQNALQEKLYEGT